jgi:hypothetical protein
MNRRHDGHVDVSATGRFDHGGRFPLGPRRTGIAIEPQQIGRQERGAGLSSPERLIGRHQAESEFRAAESRRRL